MSRRVRITRTSLSDYTILSPGGREVPRVYAQLRQAIERELGPDHAAIFTEPVFDNDAGRIDWYGPTGTVRTLDELEPRARERAKDVLRSRVDDIEALAGRMEASDDRDRQRLGATLRHALPVPDERSIRVVDDQPILTQWGMVPAGREADLEVLKYFLKPEKPKESPQPPPSRPPSPRDPFRWVPAILGLLLVLVAGVTSWLLLRNCAIALPATFGGGEPIVLVSYCDQDSRDRTALLDLIDKLENDLQNQRVSCPQYAGEPKPAPDPLPAPDDQCAENPPPENEEIPPAPNPPKGEQVQLSFHERRPPGSPHHGLCSYALCNSGWIPMTTPDGDERERCGPIPKVDVQVSRRHRPGPGQCLYLYAPTSWPDVDWPPGARMTGRIDLKINGQKVVEWPYDFTLPNQSMLERLRQAGRPFYAPIEVFNRPNLAGDSPQ